MRLFLGLKVDDSVVMGEEGTAKLSSRKMERSWPAQDVSGQSGWCYQDSEEPFPR